MVMNPTIELDLAGFISVRPVRLGHAVSDHQDPPTSIQKRERLLSLLLLVSILTTLGSPASKKKYDDKYSEKKLQKGPEMKYAGCD